MSSNNKRPSFFRTVRAAASSIVEDLAQRNLNPLQGLSPEAKQAREQAKPKDLSDIDGKIAALKEEKEILETKKKLLKRVTTTYEDVKDLGLKLKSVGLEKEGDRVLQIAEFIPEVLK